MLRGTRLCRLQASLALRCVEQTLCSAPPPALSSPVAEILVESSKPTDSVNTENWCRSMCRHTREMPRDFCTLEVHNALVEICENLSSKPVSVVHWCATITSIINVDASIKTLFATEAMVSSIVTLLRSESISSDADAVRALLVLVAIFTNNSGEIEKRFATSTVCEALVFAGRRITTVVAGKWWCNAVTNILYSLPKHNYLVKHEDLRDILLTLAPLTNVSEDTCRSWLACTSSIARLGKGRVFATAEMRDALLSTEPFVSGQTLIWLCGTIADIAADRSEETVKVFNVRSVHDFLVRFHLLATDKDSSRCWCAAVSRLVFASSTENVFGTKQFRDALIHVAPAISDLPGAAWWLDAVSDIVKNKPSVQTIFGTRSLFDKLVLVYPHAASSLEGTRAWIACVARLIRNDVTVCEILSSNNSIIKLLQNFNFYDDASIACWWCRVVANCIVAVPRGQLLFLNQAVCDQLLLLRQVMCSDGTTCSVWLGTVARVTQGTDSGKALREATGKVHKIYGTVAMRSALHDTARVVHNAGEVYWWARVLANFISDHRATQSFFGTEEVRDALLVLAEIVTNGTDTEVSADAVVSDACRMWLLAVAKLSQGGPSVHARFATATVRNIMIRMFRRLCSSTKTSAQTYWCWCIAASHLTASGEGRTIFCTPEFRDAMLEVHRLLCDPSHGSNSLNLGHVVRSWVSSLEHLAAEGAQLFIMSAFRDALISSHVYLSSPVSVCWWCGAVSKLAKVKQTQGQNVIWGTKEMRHALLKLAPFVKTSECCQAWAAAVTCIVFSDRSTQQPFATPEMRDALLQASAMLTSASAAVWWLAALSKLVQGNKEAQILFGTTAMHGTLIQVFSLCTTAESQRRWMFALYDVTRMNVPLQQRFATPQVKNALMILSGVVTSGSPYRKILQATARNFANSSTSAQILFRDVVTATR